MTKPASPKGDRKPSRPKHRPHGPCSVPDCGRRAYARGLCQSHHRQLLDKGKVQPIRPYRKRVPGTVKLAGLRVTPFCADRIRQHAAERNTSLAGAIADVLEGWVQKRVHRG